MDEYILNTCNQFDKEVKQIGNENLTAMQAAEKLTIRAQQCLLKLRNHVINTGFTDEVDEIRFFKTIKPYIQGILIFNLEIFRIESERPDWCNQLLSTFLEEEIKKVDSFLSKNTQLMKYIDNQMTNMDNEYFLCSRLDAKLKFQKMYFEIDLSFSTNQDYNVACLNANTNLRKFLLDELARNKKCMESESTLPKVSWTNNKSDLVELIYALQQSGCINYGNIEIKELVALFETTLNIDLSDSYRIFANIKNRSNPSKFLDSLRESMLKRIEQQENL